MLESFYRLASKIKRSNFPGRRLLNSLYWQPETVVVHFENLDYVVVDDCKFYASNQIDSIQRVKGNPWFANVRPTDVVMDVGANVGAITIPLAKVAKKVYAIEPVWHEELERNLKLNDLENVIVWVCGIGKALGTRAISFSSKENYVRVIPFQVIREKIEPIDFLKVDCEGCEWDIEPVELTGIREIRVEFHIRRGRKKQDYAKFREWEDWLTKSNYKFTTTYGAQPGPCVPFVECILVNASKETIEKY